MNEELLHIELLSVKEAIKEKKISNDKTVIKHLFLFILVTGLVLWGLTVLVYKSFFKRYIFASRTIELMRIYYFVLIFLGILFGIGIMILFYYFYQIIYCKCNEDKWLTHEAKMIMKYSVISEDTMFYYIEAENDRHSKIRIEKSSCRCITHSLDNYPILMGTQSILLYMNHTRLFIIKNEEMNVPKMVGKWGRPAKKASLIMLTIVSSSVLLSFYWTEKIIFGPLTTDMNQTETFENQEEHATDLKLPQTQQKEEMSNYQATIKNELHWDSQIDALFLTTNSGEDWTYVPIEPEWLRSGSYLLTSGEIPEGYWMDKSYGISPEFSWFIYSHDENNLYTLQSMDNGKNWTSSLVAENVGRIRYRKANYYTKEAGTLIISQETVMSEESIRLFTTTDNGVHWSQIGATSISQPIQNSSFLSQMFGFIATRNQLYYTQNGGNSFKEAVVSIPNDYKNDGVDLFQSPNEITQIDSNTLETKFYLVKTNGIDIGKIFSCLYRSKDNGETWQFIEQLAQITMED